MAIKVGGTTVIDDSRNVDNIGTIKGLSYPSADGTAGQFLKTDGAGNLAFQTVQTDPTIATLTKSFASGETASITLSQAITTAPVVSVIKEVSQTGVSSKGSWDVASDGGNYERQDTAYDTTLTPSSQGWDTTTASYVNNKNVSAQESAMQEVFFKPDGTKMYLLGNGADNVYEYNLSTAYDVQSSSFVQSFSISSQDNFPRGLFFRADGLKMYMTGQADNVHEYNLSTAWDISTASYLRESSYLFGDPQAIFFKPDGTKAFATAEDSNLYEYNLSTPWDVTTMSQTAGTHSISNNAKGIYFKSDGTKMYIAADTGDVVTEYNLTTAWDASTLSFVNNFSISGSGQTTTPTGLAFSNTGHKMFVCDFDQVFQYELDVTNVLVLGSGSFSSSDVGKTIEGNGGKAILTATNGSYSVVTAFTDSSTIASGDWGMFATVVNVTDGLELSNYVNGFVSPDNWTYTGKYLNLENSNVTNPIIAHSLIANRFGDNGTKLYVCSYDSDRVWQINLSTPYDITTGVFDSTLSISAQDTVPFSIFFKPDGTKMFMLGISSSIVFQYSLSTPWELSTASYDSVSQLIPAQTQGPSKIFFKPDGTKLFVCSSSGDHIQELSLSTAWDITTMSSVFKYSISAVSTSPRGIYIKDDGLTYYLITADLDRAYEYNMSTAWDISTSSYSNNFISIRDTSGAGTEPEDIDFKPDGTLAIIGDQGGSAYVREWSTGELFSPSGTYEVSLTNVGGQIDTTTWLDLNTMAGDQDAGNGEVYYAVSTDGRTTWSVIKEGDGVRPIVRDNAGTWEYNSNTGNPNAWDVSAATFVRSESVSSEDTEPEDVFFKPDGTKMYVLGNAGNDVNEYNLSTAWDVSSKTFNQNFAVGSQDGSPEGLFFKPDGTKMYVLGTNNSSVFEYNLASAWDISTASYSQAFSNFTGANSGFFFKPDGSKMYICEVISSDISEFNLSTPWDVSSASYLQNLAIGSVESAPKDVFFKSNGTKMYVLGEGTGDKVYEYDLSTAWDLSSASYNGSGETLDVSSKDTAPTGMFFNSDGSRLYVVGENSDNVHQYNIGTNAYSTSATWESATTNAEIEALQEALSVENNRMDNTQLSAVTDPNHFTLGNSLDLMIGLYQGTASVNVPSSDGVTINYDAEALQSGAVLGTDYNFDAPDSTTIRLTSNATQNLKIRVV